MDFSHEGRRRNTGLQNRDYGESCFFNEYMEFDWKFVESRFGFKIEFRSKFDWTKE